MLLSSDLAPRLMSTLAVVNAAAQVACRAWNAAWEATRKQRRELHLAPQGTALVDFFDKFQTVPDEPDAPSSILFLTALPGGRLCIVF